MLRKIVDLKSGDCVIQNAANSTFGQMFIQMAKAEGVKTINVIRNRPHLEETVAYLKALGADCVVTSEDLAEKGFSRLNTGLPQPKLALDAVGGQAPFHLSNALERGGTVAVYGVLSGKPCQIPQGDLVFRKIKVTGFWLTE